MSGLRVVGSGAPSSERVSTETVIVVFTCRSHLPNRVDALRNTWLAEPLPQGVEIVLVVGEGRAGDKLPDDVVPLDCPDDYKNNALKTMAIARFVLSRYQFSTLIKVDDDCYVPDIGRLADSGRGYDQVGYRKMVSKSSDRRLPVSFMYGGTYALSHRAVVYLVDNEDALLRESLPEDVMVGLAVEDMGSAGGGPARLKHDARYGVIFRKPFLFSCACLPLCVVLMHQTPGAVRRLHRFNRRYQWALRLLSGTLVMATNLFALVRGRSRPGHPLEVITP